MTGGWLGREKRKFWLQPLSITIINLKHLACGERSGFFEIQAVGLSRIARGEVVSFCVPAVFWWLLSYSTRVHVSFLLLCAVLCCFGIFFCSLCFFVVTLCPCNILMAFIIFDKSSCIMFAVVRSTLLLLHFLLHSLFFRSYLVSPQYFDGFYHIRQEFMYHVCCCAQYFVIFWAFICILCAFVINLCSHSFLKTLFFSGNSPCSIFALCVVLWWFCTCVRTLCCFRTYLVSLQYFDGFCHIRQ